MNLQEKTDAWRGKFPERATTLRRSVARLLGCPLNSKLSEAAIGEMCKPWEDKLLATVYGLSDDAP